MLSQYKFCFHEVISKNFFKEPVENKFEGSFIPVDLSGMS
jgi:hypothetical protein